MGKNERDSQIKNIMKRHKLLVFQLLLIITIFCIIMGYVRFSNDRLLPQNFYHSWSKNYVKTQGKYAYVNTTPNQRKATSLSEGQGYGMLITVLAAKKGYSQQKDFNKFYNYYLVHRQIIDKNPTQLMRWKQTINKKSITDENNSATDGDLYIAYSLILAHRLWPKAKNYLSQAKKLCNDILKYEYNPKHQMLTVGNWANYSSHYYNLMRTSDVTPEIFNEFYQVTGDTTWLTIKNSMLKYLNQLSHTHKSGLVPDFAWVKNGHAYPVKGKVTGSKYDGDYYSNACRIPMLLATSKEKDARNTLHRLLNFFKKQQTITAGYTLKERN